MPDLAEIPAFEFTGASAIPADVLQRSRAGAEAIGYAHGWAQGVREAKESMAAEQQAARRDTAARAAQAAQQIAGALSALAAATAALKADADEQAAALEPALMAAAVTLAEALVGHELREVGPATRDALTRMIGLAPRDEATTIRINSAAYASLTEAGIDDMLAGITGTSGRVLRVEPDDTIAVGDAVARFGATTIDGRLSEGIARIRQELAG